MSMYIKDIIRRFTNGIYKQVASIIPENKREKIESVVSCHPSGMGNRIKSLLSSMRLDENARVYWKKSKTLNCEFNDLFENDIAVKKIPKVARVYSNWRFIVLPEDNLPNGFAKERPDESGRNIDFEFERIPQEIRNKYLEQINRLIPVEYIRSEVKEFSKNFNNKTVSVSIRSWDSVKGSKNPKFKERIEASKIENFITAIDATIDTIKDSKFFVSTDSKKYFDKLKDRYGSKIIYYREKPGFTLNTPLTARDAMVDLLLLGKNRIMFGAYLSTFTELAWWFGECRSKVYIVKNADEEKVKEFLIKNQCLNMYKLH